MANKKPNILVIFGDDIGQTNVSAYSMGLMGYWTPNIDRLAKEGTIFTDYYAEQSCTAGRSTFLTGQATLRTGLSKVGIPRRSGRTPGAGRHYRAIAEAPRLRHRAVRQEPPRRQERVPARPSTASTSSLATFTTSTPRRSRRTSTILEIPNSARRFGPRGVLQRQGYGHGRPDRAAALGPCRQADDRGHGPAHPQADGDDRRRDLGRGDGVHGTAGPRRASRSSSG